MYISNTILLAATAFSSIIHSHAIDLQKRASPITIDVAPAGNAIVKVTMKNTGTTDLSLYKYGTIMEPGPVQKLAVLKNGAMLAHEGILRRYLTANLTEDAFTTLKAGQSVSETIDLASIADLSAGGAYDVVAAGAIPLAAAGTTALSGESVTYESNKLQIQVHGAAAANVEKAVKALDRRTSVQGCSGSQNTALRTALTNAVSLSNAAASAASSGSASKFSEYFKSTASSVRSTVAARFRAVATQAGTTTGGATTYYCTDVYGYCSSNVLAYTIPSYNVIANCPIYYSNLPALTGTCHRQDQATTTLHEFTHAPGTYNPGTQDYAYGYSASVALSSSQAVLNADSYALFANAIYVGC